MDFSNRLTRRMKELNLKQVDISKAVGSTAGSVSNWVSGRGVPKGSNLLLLAKILKCDPTWLITGEGAPSLSSNVTKYNPPISVDNKGLFPLISWVQAGDWSSIELLPPDDYKYYPCPVKCSNHTFVLRVRGFSMSPIFRDGELIYVDPEACTQHNTYVIARMEDNNEATFKKLVIEDGKKFLKAENPDWQPQYVPINGNCTIVGAVIFVGREI